MSPKAAEARLTRTMSSGDIFAPKGGFSCPAFNSLPYSLDFDFSDLNPSNPSVLMYDGLELSPLASSFQMPPLGAKVRSPLARVNKAVVDAPRGRNAGGDSDRQRRLMVQHQQPQQHARKGSEGENGGSETDYTTPTTEPPLTCNRNNLLATSSRVLTPDTEPAGATRSTDTSQSRASGKVASEESIWDRAFSASIRMLASTKRALPQMPVATEVAQAEIKPQKKRRVVKKDPNKPKPKPWSESELAQFRKLVKAEGANNWAQKAEKLGTKRSAKSLHTRWLREEGRIVDRPRGAAAMRQHEIEAATKGK